MGSKYDQLADELERRGPDVVDMSFDEISEVVGGLPASARQYQAWWANDRSHQQAYVWITAGWRTESVNLTAGRVRFVRA